jgi:hypothetical protein
MRLVRVRDRQLSLTARLPDVPGVPLGAGALATVHRTSPLAVLPAGYRSRPERKWGLAPTVHQEPGSQARDRGTRAIEPTTRVARVRSRRCLAVRPRVVVGSRARGVLTGGPVLIVLPGARPKEEPARARREQTPLWERT